MFRDLKNNNCGVVFVTVLIIIIVAMTLAVSVLSLNISQVKSSEMELKYTQSKILADGALARFLMHKESGGVANQISYTETIGNTTFTITATLDDGSGIPSPGSNSFPLDIDVTF